MSGSLLLSTAMLQFLAAYMVIVITPGPIALTTGSLACLHGFCRTIPLLAGIGVGTVALTALMALGAVQLAASLSIPVVKILGASVLGWLAWRIARTAPPTTTEQPRNMEAGLFAWGVLVSFLSPLKAAFFAIAFSGLMLPIRDPGEALATAAIAAVFGVGWYSLVAVALSRPVVRTAAMRRHRAICMVAGCLLAILALVSAMSAFSGN